MVEYQLPKLATGVRFPSLAPFSLYDSYGIEARERRPSGGIGLRPTANELATQVSYANRSSRFPSLAPLLANGPAARGILVLLSVVLLSVTGCATKPRSSHSNLASQSAQAPIIIEQRYIEPSSARPERAARPAPKAQSGGKHIVRSGETLWAISKLYGVDVDTLASTNSLDDSRTIEVGQVLVLPGSTLRKPVSAANFSARRSSTFMWPVKGEVASRFGSKSDKFVNKGIDIKAAEGSSVTASRGGKIVYCDAHLKGFGQTVIIDHMDGFQTVYSYNDAISVKLGDTVNQLDTIARVGSTGRAREPMLHFEIRKNGVPQNPEFYLSK